MYEFSVSVRKLTDVDLMREACEMTFNGHSTQSLLSIYKSEHSPARTQVFWIKLTSIPLFIATHFIRHHVGSTPFQLTCRDDRNGANPHFKEHIKQVRDRIHGICDDLTTKKSDAEICDALDDIATDLAVLGETSDRYTPVNLGLFINAQSLLDMAKLRLCNQAHKETVQVFKAIKEKIHEVDPDLANLMVRKCVYRNGLCGEPRCCGFNSTEEFVKERMCYLNNFSDVQQGTNKRI